MRLSTYLVFLLISASTAAYATDLACNATGTVDRVMVTDVRVDISGGQGPFKIAIPDQAEAYSSERTYFPAENLNLPEDGSTAPLPTITVTDIPTSKTATCALVPQS